LTVAGRYLSQSKLGRKLKGFRDSGKYAWLFFTALGLFLASIILVVTRDRILPAYREGGVGGVAMIVGELFGHFVGRALLYGVIILAIKGLWSLWKRLVP
jgi:hypothetical protein